MLFVLFPISPSAKVRFIPRLWYSTQSECHTSPPRRGISYTAISLLCEQAVHARYASVAMLPSRAGQCACREGKRRRLTLSLLTGLSATHKPGLSRALSVRSFQGTRRRGRQADCSNRACVGDRKSKSHDATLKLEASFIFRCTCLQSTGTPRQA